MNTPIPEGIQNNSVKRRRAVAATKRPAPSNRGRNTVRINRLQSHHRQNHRRWWRTPKRLWQPAKKS